MSHYTQHPYTTRRGPSKADWALLAFVLIVYAFAMHQDHKAELLAEQAEQTTIAALEADE